MAASHFFVGLSAGIALLAIPVLTLTPAGDLGHRLEAWIEGPPTEPAAMNADIATRPERGYRPGDPTPIPESVPPTVVPRARPTSAPRVQAPTNLQPVGSSIRSGMIRGNGMPVYVRSAPGAEGPDDPTIHDGSPVLINSTAQVGDEQWCAIRGLGGIAGWVPSSVVAVDSAP